MDADLMSIGQQCHFPACRQRDFLPFTCGRCQQAYCLEHRSLAAHQCTHAGVAEFSTVICPVCAKAIRLQKAEDANGAWNSHVAQGCDPANYAKVHHKRRCPVPGCKEKLNSVNTYCCKSCSTDVCLKHRFPGDHACNERLAAARNARSPLTAVSRFFGGGGSAAIESASSRQAENSSGDKATAKREACPLCSAWFRDIGELVRHSETAHGAGEQEFCPHCGLSFPSVVALVNHVERHHALRQPSCVLS